MLFSMSMDGVAQRSRIGLGFRIWSAKLRFNTLPLSVQFRASIASTIFATSCPCFHVFHQSVSQHSGAALRSAAARARTYHMAAWQVFTRDTCPRQIVKEPLSSSAFLRANIRLTDRCTFRSRFWLLHMRNFLTCVAS